MMNSQRTTNWQGTMISIAKKSTLGLAADTDRQNAWPWTGANVGGRRRSLGAIWLVWASLLAIAPLAAGAAEDEAAAALQMPPGKPVKVNVSVDLVEVSQIVDHDQKFELEFNVFYSWHDPRFAFDAAREGVGSKLIPAEAIWNPEPELCDELDVDVRGGKAVRALPDGTLCFSRHYRGTIGGSLDLHEFPLDRHTLEVDLEESVFEADQVVFVPTGAQAIAPDRAVPHGWKLNGISSEVQTTSNARTGERYSMLRMNLEVERDPHYYLWAIVLPLIPIVATAWSVFWMHPKEFSSQVTVGITAMLTIVAYRISVDSSLPPLSYMTRMDYFLLACQVFVFGAFLVVVAIHIFSVRGTADGQAIALRLNMSCRWLPPFLLAASSVLLIVLPAAHGQWILLGTGLVMLGFYPPTPANVRMWWVALTGPLEDIPHEHVGSSQPSLSAGSDHHASGSGSVPRPASLEPRRRTVA
jgi:Neurotransmitter-gated ion-channel ligand binding domain/Neurotransmitter-gated ion-channel transmembrane region